MPERVEKTKLDGWDEDPNRTVFTAIDVETEVVTGVEAGEFNQVNESNVRKARNASDQQRSVRGITTGHSSWILERMPVDIKFTEGPKRMEVWNP
jgi:hypothetical protein